MQIYISKKTNRKELCYIPKSVIMGRTGSGKTTLLNKICNTNHEARAGRSSVTRNLYLNSNSAGNCRFELIDTPGTNSSTEALKHAILLREALTATEINTIFIIVRYENRFETLLNNYLEDQNSIDKFDKKIVVLISHSDHSTDPENDFKMICETFSDWCSNIIFYSEKSNSDELANLMFNCMSQMEKEKLQITDEDFHFKFNIASISIKRQMIQAQIDFETSLDRTNKELKEFASSTCLNFNDIHERDEFLRSVIVEHKYEMEKILFDFQEKYKDHMIELDSYCLYIKLQKKIVELCLSFVESITPYMSYSVNNPYHPRNIYKKCPHCMLVWVKIVGCDNVKCGDRVNIVDENENQLKRKFVIEKRDAKYTYIQETYEYLMQKTNELYNDLIRSKLYKMEGKGNGCGRHFNWQTEAICLKDEEIYELLTVKTIDEAIQLIKNQDFIELKNKYVKEIDTTFHH